MVHDINVGQIRQKRRRRGRVISTVDPGMRRGQKRLEQQAEVGLEPAQVVADQQDAAGELRDLARSHFAGASGRPSGPNPERRARTYPLRPRPSANRRP